MLSFFQCLLLASHFYALSLPLSACMHVIVSSPCFSFCIHIIVSSLCFSHPPYLKYIMLSFFQCLFSLLLILFISIKSMLSLFLYLGNSFRDFVIVSSLCFSFSLCSLFSYFSDLTAVISFSHLNLVESMLTFFLCLTACYQPV